MVSSLDMCWRIAAAAVIMLSAAGSSRPALRPAPADEAAKAPTTRPVVLFNGKDLNGFDTYLRDTKRADPRGVFSVTTDGLLRISGDGYGYLSTKDSWCDYILIAEYKWGAFNRPERKHNARDSGLFLHSAGPDGNSTDGDGAFKAAIECQIMQGAVGDFLLINGKDGAGEPLLPRLTTTLSKRKDADGYRWFDPKGEPHRFERGPGRVNWLHKSERWRDVLDFRGARDVDTRDGWTRLECHAQGSTLRISVNGTVVNQATDVWPAHGPILIQCEGSEIFFRRLELHPSRAAR